MAALAASGLLALSACSGPDKPEDVALQYYTAFIHGDIEEAWDYIYVPPGARGNQNATSQAHGKLRQMSDSAMEKIKEKGGVQSIRPLETRQIESGDEHQRLNVTLEITANDGSTEREVVKLVMEGDKWKVDI